MYMLSIWITVPLEVAFRVLQRLWTKFCHSATPLMSPGLATLAVIPFKKKKKMKMKKKMKKMKMMKMMKMKMKKKTCPPL
ncbi:hypothetical protein LINPERPRIM_LOCUS4374 [Linum perenne]